MLIKHYRGPESLKDARRILALAQKRWPDAAEVLNDAPDIALQSAAINRVKDRIYPNHDTESHLLPGRLPVCIDAEDKLTEIIDRAPTVRRPSCMKSAIAIRHVGFEDLGAFAPALRAAGYHVDYWDIGEQELRALEPVETDLLIVLGGPIGVYEDAAYPFLAEETAILEQRLAANRPTLGICLGAQLIARAAGARVFPSGAKEIGFAPITLTEAGRSSCLAPFANEPMTLHWHGDTFDLPAGATRLASTDLCENQAFAMGPNIVGFQFHPEAPAKGFEKWLVGHAAELAAANIHVPRLRAAAQVHGPELERKAEVVLSAWLGGLEV